MDEEIFIMLYVSMWNWYLLAMLFLQTFIIMMALKIFDLAAVLWIPILFAVIMSWKRKKELFDKK